MRGERNRGWKMTGWKDLSRSSRGENLDVYGYFFFFKNYKEKGLRKFETNQGQAYDILWMMEILYKL